MPIDPLLAPPRLLEVSHVAHRLSVTQRKVWRWIREGHLPAVRLDTRLRVDPADLQAFIDARRVARTSTERRESSVHPLPHAVNR